MTRKQELIEIGFKVVETDREHGEEVFWLKNLEIRKRLLKSLIEMEGFVGIDVDAEGTFGLVFEE